MAWVKLLRIFFFTEVKRSGRGVAWDKNKSNF